MINKVKQFRWLYAMLFILALNQTIILGFTDLDPEDPDTIYIEQLEERGLTNGYPDGTYRPEGSITRSELIALVNRTFAFQDAAETHNFLDIDEKQWYEEHVRIAIQEGYINGYPDHTFRPLQNISRGEVAAILMRIMDLKPTTFYETSDEVDKWVFDAVQCMLSADIMSLDQKNAFNARTPITRGEVATSLIKALEYRDKQQHTSDEVPQDVSDGGTNVGSSDNPGNGGGSGSGESSKDNPSSEVVYALNLVVKGLEDVENRRTYFSKKLDSTQMGIVKDVHVAVQKYLNDYSYDYDGAMNAVKADINVLVEDQRSLLKNAIKEAVPMQYEELLRDYFDIYEESI